MQNNNTQGIGQALQALMQYSGLQGAGQAGVQAGKEIKQNPLVGLTNLALPGVTSAVKNTPNPLQPAPGYSSNPILGPAQRTGKLAQNTLGSLPFWMSAASLAPVVGPMGQKAMSAGANASLSQGTSDQMNKLLPVLQKLQKDGMDSLTEAEKETLMSTNSGLIQQGQQVLSGKGLLASLDQAVNAGDTKQANAIGQQIMSAQVDSPLSAYKETVKRLLSSPVLQQGSVDFTAPISSPGLPPLTPPQSPMLPVPTRNVPINAGGQSVGQATLPMLPTAKGDAFQSIRQILSNLSPEELQSFQSRVATYGKMMK